MAERSWQITLEAELRAAGGQLELPEAPDLTMVVRDRLGGRVVTGRRVPAWRPGGFRGRLVWRAVLIGVTIFLAVLVATPQGRAMISGVFRFAGVEIRQQPGHLPGTGRRGLLPGERRMSLAQARRQVAFPVLVPRALGRPAEVVVSDRGRVVSLIYRGTRYGLVELDEFAGQPDQIYFVKFVHHTTVVRVDGTRGLWIRGPQKLVYVTRDGVMASASARLTTGNTVIWGTTQVALRLEGNFGKAAALGIADSVH